LRQQCRDDVRRRRNSGGRHATIGTGLGIRGRRHGELDSRRESRVKPLSDESYLGCYKNSTET